MVLVFGIWGFGIWYFQDLIFGICYLQLPFHFDTLTCKVALQVNYHVPTEYAGKWSPAPGMHCSRGAVIMQVGKGVS